MKAFSGLCPLGIALKTFGAKFLSPLHSFNNFPSRLTGKIFSWTRSRTICRFQHDAMVASPVSCDYSSLMFYIQPITVCHSPRLCVNNDYIPFFTFFFYPLPLKFFFFCLFFLPRKKNRK